MEGTIHTKLRKAGYILCWPTWVQSFGLELGCRYRTRNVFLAHQCKNSRYWTDWSTTVR